jgi:hypothetical protein
VIFWPLYVLCAVAAAGAVALLVYRFKKKKSKLWELPAVYGFCALLGVFLIDVRTWAEFGPQAVIAYRAARDLPANHFLIPSVDLEEPEGLAGDLQLGLPSNDQFAQKYLLSAHRKHDPILLSETAAAPTLAFPANSILWTVAIDYTDSLDAGKPVLVYAESCITPARMAAVYCGKDGCKSAAIFVPVSNAERLFAAKSAKLVASSEGTVCAPPANSGGETEKQKKDTKEGHK